MTGWGVCVCARVCMGCLPARQSAQCRATVAGAPSLSQGKGSQTACPPWAMCVMHPLHQPGAYGPILGRVLTHPCAAALWWRVRVGPWFGDPFPAVVKFTSPPSHMPPPLCARLRPLLWHRRNDHLETGMVVEEVEVVVVVAGAALAGAVVGVGVAGAGAVALVAQAEGVADTVAPLCTLLTASGSATM